MDVISYAFKSKLFVTDAPGHQHCWLWVIYMAVLRGNAIIGVSVAVWTTCCISFRGTISLIIFDTHNQNNTQNMIIIFTILSTQSWWHDSNAVVACAKFHHDHINGIRYRAKWDFMHELKYGGWYLRHGLQWAKCRSLYSFTIGGTGCHGNGPTQL